jgi:hypothetical protein
MMSLDALDDKIHAALDMAMGAVVGVLFARSSAAWLGWLDGDAVVRIGTWRLGSGQGKQFLVKAVYHSK